MFKVFVLICRLSTVPNAADCTTANAYDFIRGPAVPNALACFMTASDLARRQSDTWPADAYAKFLCQMGPRAPLPENLG